MGVTQAFLHLSAGGSAVVADSSCSLALTKALCCFMAAALEYLVEEILVQAGDNCLEEPQNKKQKQRRRQRKWQALATIKRREAAAAAMVMRHPAHSTDAALGDGHSSAPRKKLLLAGISEFRDGLAL